MGKKLNVDEAIKIYLATDSYYLKRDMRKFLKKMRIKLPKSD